MDAATLQMLRTSLAHVLTEEGDAPLSARLSQLGWEDVLAEDPVQAVQALFSIRGATLSAADALGPVLARAVADSTGRPDLAEAIVVLPRGLHPDRLTSRIDGPRMVADGVATASPAGRIAIVPVADGGGMRIALPPAGIAWSEDAIEGTDPSMGLVRISATFAAPECRWIDGADAEDAWVSCTARARWALGAELVGIAQHVIARAVEYTVHRKQYGRAIGTFQALQHRLASAYASVVGASDTVAEAAATGSPWVALVAKALAGRAAENACTQAQQSYGAIGFTWEHEFHRYLRRAYVLDWLLGDWRTLERAIGAHLIDGGAVPLIGSL